MIVLPPDDRRSTVAVPRLGGNASDARYLHEALAALEPLLADCVAAAASADVAVQLLAARTLTEQAARRTAVAALLADPDPPGRDPREVDEALGGLEGAAADLFFIERLTAHAHASTTAARAEMIAGADRSARALARAAIHADLRRLAALDHLLADQTREPAPPAVEG